MVGRTGGGSSSLAKASVIKRKDSICWANAPTRRILGAEIGPIQGALDVVFGGFARAFEVSDPAILEAVIDHRIGGCRGRFDKIPVVLALEIDDDAREIVGALVVAGEMAPERGGQAVGRGTGDAIFESLAFVHESNSPCISVAVSFTDVNVSGAISW